MCKVFNSFDFEGPIWKKQKPESLQSNPSQSHTPALYAAPTPGTINRYSDQSCEGKTSEKKVPNSTWQNFKYSQKCNKYHHFSADKRTDLSSLIHLLLLLSFSGAPSLFLFRFFSVEYTFAFLLPSLNSLANLFFGPVQMENKDHLHFHKLVN